ncbi:MAG TPA: GntR family transcriptional regulator [Anaerolineales bacterium]|nr:GntR family transcriptional regulator [Anaerolineales bacterium]
MNEEINKPLYVRIQEYIAELILSGKLMPEAKIQSERDFSEDLGVSRMTVRRAITELVNEGLLERKHGSGTYVAKPKVTYESSELVNYVQAMQHRNIATASQLLEFGQLAASRRLAESLQIEIGNPIYRVAILRFANRVPVVLERVFIPSARCPDLEEWDLEKSSIYDLLTEAYHIDPCFSSQTLEAVAAADTVAQQLRVDEGFPLLMLSRIVFEKGAQRPVVFSQDFLRSDYARIHTDGRLGEHKEGLQENRKGKEESAGNNA